MPLQDKSSSFCLPVGLLVPVLLCACGDGYVNVPVDGGPDSGPLDAGPEIPVTTGCENLEPLHCMLPWPSSRFLTEDSETVTGFRVDLPEEHMPRDGRGRVITRTKIGRASCRERVSSPV